MNLCVVSHNRARQIVERPRVYGRLSEGNLGTVCVQLLQQHLRLLYEEIELSQACLKISKEHLRICDTSSSDYLLHLFASSLRHSAASHVFRCGINYCHAVSRVRRLDLTCGAEQFSG